MKVGMGCIEKAGISIGQDQQLGGGGEGVRLGVAKESSVCRAYSVGLIQLVPSWGKLGRHEMIGWERG